MSLYSRLFMLIMIYRFECQFLQAKLESVKRDVMQESTKLYLPNTPHTCNAVAKYAGL